MNCPTDEDKKRSVIISKQSHNMCKSMGISPSSSWCQKPLGTQPSKKLIGETVVTGRKNNRKYVGVRPSELKEKRIMKVRIAGISKEYDDRPYLVIIMEDGSRFRIVSCYGGYTGESEGEYPSFIRVEKYVK